MINKKFSYTIYRIQILNEYVFTVLMCCLPHNRFVSCIVFQIIKLYYYIFLYIMFPLRLIDVILIKYCTRLINIMTMNIRSHGTKCFYI